MSFAITAKSKGEEDKVITALRRLTEEDPMLEVHHDDQTGEMIVGGMSQVHVEVTVERMKRRFGVEVELKPPRVPYRETIKGTAKAEGKHKKQTGGRGQFADTLDARSARSRAARASSSRTRSSAARSRATSSRRSRRACAPPWTTASSPAIPSSTST